MAYFYDPTPPDLLVDHLRSARRLVVLTGAGISAKSGIPTFRDAQNGICSQFDVSRLASPEGFRRNPSLVWAWYESRRLAALRAKPNAGHTALTQIVRLSWLENAALLTQNVDDLHERAGSSGVVHLHGSLFEPRCSACGDAWQPTADAAALQPPPEVAHGTPGLRPPCCLRCGGDVRPGVVWFGEALPEQVWLRAMRIVATADLMLVVGTSATVHPVASLPATARHNGCKVWVIDPNADASASADYLHWLVNAATGLPSLHRQAS